jgi:vacuolar-type H+-ATPase subunit F/Vma7
MSETASTPAYAEDTGAPRTDPPPTRMIFLGEDCLSEGFRVIGFETHANPTAPEVDRVFRELLTSREKAFVIVDDAVMQMQVDHLNRVRREGGRIVVVAIPPLAAPPTLRSEVAERLASMFGGDTLMQPTAIKDST